MKNKPETVGTAKLASILGISDRRVQHLVSEGILRKEKRGTYQLAASVQAYIAYKVESSRSGSSGTKVEEETRLLKARADREEIELARIRKELIPAILIKSTWQRIVASARTRFLGLHSALKTQHPDLDISVIQTLEGLVRQALTEMSEDGLPDRTEHDAG